MKNAAYFGRCARRAIQWDGFGHGLVQFQSPTTGIEDDPGFDLTVYETAQDLQNALIEDLGITPEEADGYMRCGVMQHVPHTQVYIFNRNGIYGRLDVEPKQMPNLDLLKNRLRERINGARHV